MIRIKSEKTVYGINFPTSVDEITPEILNEITKRVSLPNNYCIVMLAYKTRLFDFVASMNSKKDISLSVVPVMAKISDEDGELINSHVGDRIIIERSCLERGVHVQLPTMISTANVRNYFSSDPNLSKAIIRGEYSSDIKDANIIIVEFKIVPINDISASIPKGEEPIDPFLFKFGDQN